MYYGSGTVDVLSRLVGSQQLLLHINRDYITLHYITDLVSTYNVEQQTLQCHTIDAR